MGIRCPIGCWRSEARAGPGPHGPRVCARRQASRCGCSGPDCHRTMRSSYATAAGANSGGRARVRNQVGHPAKEGWWRRRCCSRCSAMPAHRDGRMHMMELELLHAVQWHASGHYAADCAMFGIVSNNWRALPKWLSEVATAVAIVKEYGTSGVFAAELRAPCRGVDVAKKAELRRANVDILGAVHSCAAGAAGASTRHFGAISL